MIRSLPYLGLVFNALVWGLSWWPLRRLHEAGLHPVWATALFFAVGTLLIGLWRPGAFAAVLRMPWLWALGLAAGTTNATFNWAVSTGEVVRVVLLFYLMPLWAVLLAWWLLDERITRAALWRVALALSGAVLVLKPATGGWPAFSGLADWLALLGGLSFALTNVLLRKLASQDASQRALSMFVGAFVLPALLGLLLVQQGRIEGLPPLDAAWLWGALAMALLFFASNLTLQYGAARLPVHITSVVMLVEVVFAAGSAVWWAGEVLSPTVLAGGALILVAALMASGDHA